MTNGTYIIPVWDTITAAWEKVSGAKKSIWGALILFFVILFAFGFTQGALSDDAKTASNIIQAIGNIIVYFLQMGMLYIGIRRAADLPIEYKQIFRAFNLNMAIKIVLLYILQILIFIPAIAIFVIASMITALIPGLSTVVPIILFALGGFAMVYLSVRMLLSNAFVLDKLSDPWSAIKASFRATQCNFWPCFGLLIMQMIILMISAIPLGIGLIWSLPFVFICYGMIYHRLSVNAEAVAVTSTTI